MNPLKLLRYIAIVIVIIPLKVCGYERTKNGIIIEAGDSFGLGAKKVLLEVINDNILRVRATAEDDFINKNSLAVIPLKGGTNFTIEDEKDDIIIRTSHLSAMVSKTTLDVIFKDSLGNQILKEEGNLRSFTPIKVDKTSCYTIKQSFLSSYDDEGLYGLGQHQADEFNYKGKSEELFQYNTKVSIPFILSTKNYGLLFDGYSFMRYGASSEALELGDAFTLYDKDFNEGFLTGTYVSKKQDIQLIREEKNISFEFLDEAFHFEKVVGLPEDFNFSGSKVTYQGYIEPKESGEYQFILYYAGYIKVYVDGKLVVPERWRAAWNPNSYKFTLQMEALKRVPIKIEWAPDGGISYLGLRAYTPRSLEEKNKISWWTEMQEEEDYYFILGDNMDKVISGYRTLTGKAPIMPKWALGFWQSRERYKTQAELLSTLKEFRLRGIPIDNIVQDWSYWPEEAWGSHEFDSERFPNPKAMVDSVHSMHGKVMISVWPKFYESTEHYKEFFSKGWMYTQAITDSIKDWIGPGYLGSFYDAYSEGARKLFWTQIEEHLYPLGFDAWWMDASEPNIKDCTNMDYRKRLSGPTALGPSTQYFNAYALMNAEAIYDGQRSIEPNRRVFQLTRSGFLGLQRYSTATWSGDIASRWEDMKAQISAGLNYSMSGIPYWSMDIGGFSVENRYASAQKEYDKSGAVSEDLNEWRELNTRWYQFGAFCPLYRAHGQYPWREVWNLAPEDHPCYNSILYYTKLRYRLLPYLYSLAAMTYFEDYTLMRPLAMDFSKDSQTIDIGDEFLLGPSLLVAPVYRYQALEREVYFPKTSSWYNLYTGEYILGGQKLKVPAPYERIPVYVPEGAIIPFGEQVEYSDEKQNDFITIYVYGGKDGNFTLYEDDGKSYNYEKGEFSKIKFSYWDKDNTLEISPIMGRYPNMIENRTFCIVKVSPKRPIAIDENNGGKIVKYKGKSLKVKLPSD